ncbi:MAG: hypothetical protein N2449_07710 [Bacteroidales bacterium]|nr:hypothetical protein [Bacteroidales bacterium]
MNNSKPQVKIVKRYSNSKRTVLYVLVSNVYSDDSSIILKIFPYFDISKSTKAERIN